MTQNIIRCRTYIDVNQSDMRVQTEKFPANLEIKQPKRTKHKNALLLSNEPKESGNKNALQYKHIYTCIYVYTTYTRQ